jgi:hypothetical protein
MAHGGAVHAQVSISGPNSMSAAEQQIEPAVIIITVTKFVSSSALARDHEICTHVIAARLDIWTSNVDTNCFTLLIHS